MAGKFRKGPGSVSSGSRLRQGNSPRVIEGSLSRAATVGEYFEAIVIDPTGLTRIEADGLEEIGLSLRQDPQTRDWLISGTLQEANLYELLLTATIGSEDVAVSLRLPVSADPWTMWKDLPVDWDTLPFPKDDTACDRIEGDLTLLAASRRGRSHAHKALPRDDDARIYVDRASGWHIGVVADGAGSAPFSRKGSEIAVETVIQALPPLLVSHLDPAIGDGSDVGDGLTRSLVQSAILAADQIVAFAGDASADPAAFSTTLVLGVAKRIESGDWFLASFSIGDGAVGLYREGDTDSPRMIAPDSGSYAGQTAFLRPDSFADEAAVAARLHHRVVPDFTALMLMTDGVSDPMFPSDIALDDPEVWGKVWNSHLVPLGIADNNPDAHHALLEWLNFKVKGEHDDRTIALMTPTTTSADPSN